MRLSVILALLLLSCLIPGCSWPSLLITPINQPLKLEEVQVQSGKGFAPDKIAIVEVEGLLMNARNDGLLTPGENKVSLFLEQFNQIESDPRVKAVVLRINSPGGTVTASDTMYQIVARFRQRTGKPVIASTQDVAASGAYYVALASDRIIAHPTSIVGSIGVIFQTMEFSETLRKIGVSTDAIKSGTNKDMGSPFRPLAAQERALMQAMVDEFYGKFRSLVVTRRALTDNARIDVATDGRVFSGEQALAHGLVDQLGTLEDAIDAARTLSHSPGARVILYKRAFGYRGSIYASTDVAPPRADSLQIHLPDTRLTRPIGFYYLWEP